MQVSQARTTEMHDWTDLNRRLSQLQVRFRAKRNTLSVFKYFFLKAKARIWP